MKCIAASRRHKVRGLGASEAERACIGLAVITQPLVVTNQHTELERLTALKNRVVFGDLPGFTVLRLRTLIERGALQRRIAAP